MRIVAKSVSYGVFHVVVATSVAYVMTWDIKVALSIGFVEPLVQTLLFPVHEYIWERKPKEKL